MKVFSSSIVSALALMSLMASAQAANFQAWNDRVWAIPIQCVNVSTSVVAACPTGTTFTVASSNANSLSASIASGTLYLTPKVIASPSISITINGTALLPQTLVVDVVADPNQLGVSLNVAGASGSPQAIPTNPGP